MRRCDRAEGSRAGVRRGDSRADKAFGDRASISRSHLRRSAHRVPDPLRRVRERRAPRRAGVLGPAEPSEAGRGKPVARRGRRGPLLPRRARRPGRGRLRVSERRHGGVPPGARRQISLHGDEHAAAGGAPGDGDGHRVDLVVQQIRIAALHALDLSQDGIRPTGHAIEFRINAEDPDEGFRPDPARSPRSPPALRARTAWWSRWDSAIEAGSRILRTTIRSSGS